MEWTRGKRLGMGSYGEVFLAVPTNPKIPVMAVKSAPEDKAGSLILERRILDEFRHVPGIIQCFGGGLDGGSRTYNLLMEYASEGSLSDLIDDYGGEEGTGIPENHVRVYTRMILQALSVIHSRGFAHCDIKPSNVLVFPAGNRGGDGVRELKVADFGLAIATWKLIPGSRHHRGTPRYVPPEVVVSGTVTPAVDIWALGCTVVEMLTGEAPWAWLDDDKDVLREISKGGRPGIPPWLSEEGKDFLNKCFAKNAIYRLDTDSFLKHPFVAPSGGNTATKKKTTAAVIGESQQPQPQQKQRSPEAAGFPLLPHEIFRHYCRPVLLF